MINLCKMGQSKEENKSTDKETENRVNKETIIDRIFNEIGGFGLFQIFVGLSTGIALLFGSFTTFNFIFASVIPEHR